MLSCLGGRWIYWCHCHAIDLVTSLKETHTLTHTRLVQANAQYKRAAMRIDVMFNSRSVILFGLF